MILWLVMVGGVILWIVGAIMKQGDEARTEKNVQDRLADWKEWEQANHDDFRLMVDEASRRP